MRRNEGVNQEDQAANILLENSSKKQKKRTTLDKEKKKGKKCPRDTLRKLPFLHLKE